MEILYSARSSAEYIAIESELDALRILRNDSAVAEGDGRCRRTRCPQRRLPPRAAHRRTHRRAAAEHGGLAVLHDDLRFERLSEVLAFDSVRLTGP